MRVLAENESGFGSGACAEQDPDDDQPHALQQVDLPSEAGVVVEVAAAMSDSLDGLPASHPSTGADEA